MGQTTTYPDGSALVSSALTIAQINAIMVPTTLQMLGLANSPTSPLVRVQWPTEGAPFGSVGDDICYLACVPTDDPYNRIRDRANLSTADPNLEEQWNFTRAWSIKWVFYGPNSTDRARALRSALYQDFFTNALSQSQLFPVSDFSEPIRVPELINGQWFERVDFIAEFYEFVTETINRQTVTSVENIIRDSSGEIADFTVAVS